MKKRSIYKKIIQRIKENQRFIQVLLGPRQVGKTTLIQQLIKELKTPNHYISADLATLQDLNWLSQQWEIAREKAKNKNGAILIIDEVQKIQNWSNMVKSLWDQDTNSKTNLFVIILGSSPWLVQKGLTESLAGRFEIIHITHWSYEEMKSHFGFSLEEYIYFGGYPGATPLIKEQERWTNYINDALIETTISRDILLMTQINKPGLLRRLFQLGCNYSGQILSFTKILGQLQDAGNATTLSHYLDLLSGAGLLCGLQKFAMQKVRQRNSSPKFLIYNTALIAALSTKTFKEAKKDKAFWGRLVESTIGAHILNSIKGTQIEVFYWREGDKEVDFVLKKGDFITAIEVKTNKDKINKSGIDTFVKKFNPNKIILVGESGISIEKFLSSSIGNFTKN